MENMIINDLNINSPYRVYNMSTGETIFELPDLNTPGDIPPDVAVLPVLGLRTVLAPFGPVKKILYIDTQV